jgi:hypothetical protein
VLVFIHINKTAGRTVRYILRSSYGARHCEAEPWEAAWGGPVFSAADLRRLRRIYPRLASIAGHRLTGYADLGGRDGELRYFTFLRDPLKLTASRFQYHVEHRKKRGLVFDEWVEREWLRNPQTKQIGGSASLDDAIRAIEAKQILVGLTDRFDESLVLLKRLRAHDLDLRYSPVNVAGSRRLADELLADPRARAAIIAANGADVELYEYAKAELYPALVREAGPSLAAAVQQLKSNGAGTFNQVRLTTSRAKQYGLYKPLLRLYRTAPAHAVVRTLLG